MADNVAVTAGSGTTIATDDVSGVHYQRVKLVDGTLDSTTAIPGDATNGLDVDVTRVSGNVTVVQATATNLKTANNDSLGQVQYNFPAGFIRTTDEPHQLFYDPFDSSLDTTNRWNAATASGGGVAASVSAGQMTLGSGTTANGYSYITSQATFTPTVPAWLGNSWAISIEFAVGNNAVRFWGHGSVGGTPSSTNPLGTTGNGYGFELNTSGVLKAVVYSNGTRTEVADLSASQPADSNLHRYICYYRTDRIFWYIDSLATPVATSNFNSPQVQALPLLALTVAHSSAPAASRVITCAGLAVWDTGKNNTTISDGTFGWRKATVNSSGALSVTGNVIGDVASGTTDSGNPIKVGGQARTTNPSAVTDGQRVNGIFDKVGRQVVVQSHVRELVGNQTTTITNSTAETTIITAAASTFNDLSSLIITNASATAFTATLKDSTAGTTRAIYAIAANGGIVLDFNPPIPQAAVNNNWTITLSVNTVTVYIQAVFVKNI